MSRTSICSIVALDLIDYAKKTEAEQLEIKSKLESLIQNAVADIAQENRIVVNSTQGAVIACCGSMEDALEDALLIALTIRDEILKNNAVSFKPMYVQCGINIGSVVLSVKDAKHDVAGTGVEEAQRIMGFANPNQILVSRVYYEMASRVTQEIASMFELYDMHALDQELYAVKLHREQSVAAAESLEVPVPEMVPDKWMLLLRKINWTYATISLFLLAGLVYMGRSAMHPQEPLITMDEPTSSVATTSIPDTQPALTQVETPPSIPAPAVAEDASPTEQAATPKEDKSGESTSITDSKPADAKSASVKRETTKPHVLTRERDRRVSNSAPVAESKSEQVQSAPASGEAATEPKEKEGHHNATASTKPAENKSSGDKSTWQSIKDSVKQGANSKCTQAQIAMNQCN